MNLINFLSYTAEADETVTVNSEWCDTYGCMGVALRPYTFCTHCLDREVARNHMAHVAECLDDPDCGNPDCPYCF